LGRASGQKQRRPCGVMRPHPSPYWTCEQGFKVLGSIRLEQYGVHPTIACFDGVDADRAARKHESDTRPADPNSPRELPAIYASSQSEISQDHVKRLVCQSLQSLFSRTHRRHVVTVWS
jgi:hypothetical protein